MRTALDKTPSMVSPQVSFRSSDPDLQKRIDRLIELLRILPAYKGLKVSSSTVHQLAHARGLDALERELGAVGPKPLERPKARKK